MNVSVTSSPHRLLVVANETASADTLNATIRSAVGSNERAEVLVVAPALNSRLSIGPSDDDEARELAMERVQRCVDRLLQDGILAKGTVGEADPIRAIEDVLHTFPADALIVSYPKGESNWLARGVIDRVEERFGLPVIHLVVDEDARLDAAAA